MAAEAPPFLGRGWSFPPSFDAGGGDVETVAGAADVAQALHVIFATEPGERPMREDFGAGLSRFVFVAIDQGLLAALRGAVRDAVIAWEPRVAIDTLDIAESGEEPGLLTIALAYTLRGSNSRYNLVYPFYVREASAGVAR